MSHIQTQTEWEAEMSVKILEFVQSELYLELRFLDTAFSALVPKPDSSLRTFSTDGTWLYFSSEQILRVFPDNPKFLNRAYLHTIFHCIFAHLWLKGNRNQYLWGIACDIAVEYTIDHLDKACTKRILSWERQKLYEKLEKEKGISPAIIYRLLLELEKEKLDVLQYEFYTDDHRYWPKDQPQENLIAQPVREKWNRIARQALIQQEQKGKKAGETDALLNSQLRAQKSRRSYRDFLRKFSVRKEELHCDPDEFDLNYYTYGLRYYGNLPLIEPVETREVHKIREFVIVIDTSDSTSGELVNGFLKETFQILMQQEYFFQKCKIRIIQCDNQVRMDEEITDTRDLDKLLNHFVIYGGGSTDFRPAFSYVNNLLEQGTLEHLDGLLYFTDGKGIYPKKKPIYKTAFLFLDEYEENEVPPWAIRLKLDESEFLTPNL